MSFKNYVKAIPLAAAAAGDFDATFQPFIATGLEEPCFLIKIINNSSEDVLISYDGTEAHDFVPEGETTILNFQTNSSPNNRQALMAKGQVIYVRGEAAGTGAVYLVGYFQPQGA